jgi:lipopolysaccharide assembly protein A
MRLILWLLRIVVFVLLISFIAKNFETVTLHYYLDYEYQLPLSIVLLIFLALGMIIGYFSLLGSKSRKKD